MSELSTLLSMTSKNVTDQIPADVARIMIAAIQAEQTAGSPVVADAKNADFLVPYQDTLDKFPTDALHIKTLVNLLEESKVQVNAGVFMAISLLACNPAATILWVNALFNMAKDLGRDVKMSDIANTFPWGFPKISSINYLWKQQIVDGKNLLDDVSNW